MSRLNRCWGIFGLLGWANLNVGSVDKIQLIHGDPPPSLKLWSQSFNDTSHFFLTDRLTDPFSSNFHLPEGGYDVFVQHARFFGNFSNYDLLRWHVLAQVLGYRCFSVAVKKKLFVTYTNYYNSCLII